MVGLVYYWVCHMSLTQGFRPQPSFPRFWRNPNYDNPLIDWWVKSGKWKDTSSRELCHTANIQPIAKLDMLDALPQVAEGVESQPWESLSTTVRCSKSRDLPRPISCFCLCPYKLYPHRYIKDRHDMVRIPVGWTISQPSGLTAPVLRFLRFPPPPLQPLMPPRPPPLFRCCPRLRRRHRLLRP